MSEESDIGPPSVTGDDSPVKEKTNPTSPEPTEKREEEKEEYDDESPLSPPLSPPPEEDDFPPPSEPPPPSPPLPTDSQSVVKPPPVKTRPPFISVNHDSPLISYPVTSPGMSSAMSPVSLQSPISLTPASAIPSRLMAEVESEHHRRSGTRTRQRSASFQHETSTSKAGSSKAKRFTTFLPLPHGWYEGFDPQGRKYYLHRKNKITQWDVPDEILQYLPPLPLGWTERKDPRGKAFYVNVKLKKTQRARPGPRDDDLLALIRRNSPVVLQATPPVTPPIIPPSPLTETYYQHPKSPSVSLTPPSGKSSLEIRPAQPPPFDIVITPQSSGSIMESEESLIKKYRENIRTDDLQTGWQVVLNKKKRYVYFYNAETKATRWDVPTIEPLAENWTARVDFDTQRRYYVNLETKQVQWSIPTIPT